MNKVIKELKQYLMVKRFTKEMINDKQLIYTVVGNDEIARKVKYILDHNKYRTHIITSLEELEQTLTNDAKKQFFILIDSNYKKYLKLMEIKNFSLCNAIVLPVYRV